MDVRNCKSCGKLYNYFGGQPYCPTCLSKLDDTFKEVKEYLYENPNTGIQEISEKFNIGIPIIHRWVREERLAFSDNSSIGIACENCGVTIKTGRFCKKCKDTLANSLASAYARKEEAKKEVRNTSAQMRFFK